MSLRQNVMIALAGLGAWDLSWWAIRRAKRAANFRAAFALSRRLGRPLVVVGAPDGGVTAGYGCGDLTIDIAPASACPNYLRADITQKIPLADNSAVVFVSCVLEYVDNVDAALCELYRVAGSAENLFIVRVEPWTLTAFLYPGARRTLVERPPPPATCSPKP